jgi:mannan endo-1,4-beta-mannosidase
MNCKIPVTAGAACLMMMFLLLPAASNGQVNPNASETCKKVYSYISGLGGDENRVLAGQNCYHGNQISDYGYEELVEGLYKSTGKYPSLLAVDYEYAKIFTPGELHLTNLKLIGHWKKNGLVTINWTARHPNGGDTRVKNDPVDLSKLFERPDWIKRVDVIAGALKELQDSGVVVLFRPMQEMNNNWFWHGSWLTPDPGNPEPYKIHWRNLYNYFTEVKGLNNLLWVYSPNQHHNPSYTKPADYHYPGHEYVDIVAPTAYSENLDLPDYDLLKNLGKPMGIAEYGKNFKLADGTVDNREYIEKIRTTYPEIKYFVVWHNWTGVKMAINSNRFAKELMYDPWIVTLEEVNYDL